MDTGLFLRQQVPKDEERITFNSLEEVDDMWIHLFYKLHKKLNKTDYLIQGVVEKPTLMGRLTNWVGKQFSYMVFDLYGGKRLLDKYNQLKVGK